MYVIVHDAYISVSYLFFLVAGINTYRKSLKRTPKEKESEKRARRSRQQRVRSYK